jgi:hypothetical protein
VTTEVLSQQLTANVQVTFGQGTVWYLKSASGPITVIAERIGTGATIRKFINVSAGFKFVADDDGWTYLRVTSPTTQTIELIIGDDDVEVSNAVTIAGNVTTLDLPATTISTPGAKVTAVTAGAALVAVNAGRRRVTIESDPLNVNNQVVYIRVAGGARIGSVVPGTSKQFSGTYALDYEAAAAGDTLYISEEA